MYVQIKTTNPPERLKTYKHSKLKYKVLNSENSYSGYMWQCESVLAKEGATRASLQTKDTVCSYYFTDKNEVPQLFGLFCILK